MRRGGVAYVPLDVFAPGLARLVAIRARLGLRSSAHTLAKLVDPFGGGAVRVVGVTHPDYLVRMREVLAATGADAMLLRGTEGEPYANPKRQPRLEMFARGEPARVVEPEEGTLAALPALPEASDAVTTAQWTADALSGSHAVPAPIVVQLSCLLEAAQAPRRAPGARRRTAADRASR